MIRSIIAVAALAGVSASASAQFVLMDQIGPNSSFTEGQPARANQEFEAANAAFHVAMIDDFFVGPNGATILTAEAVMTGFGLPTGVTNNFDRVTGWRLDIYSSPTAAATNFAGDVASVAVPAASAVLTIPFTTSAASGHVLIDVSAANINLGAGQYWMALIPQMAFAGNGQLGVNDSTFGGTPGNLNSVQTNPGGGFAFPGGQVARDTNSAYRLTAVPTPATLALLGLAGLTAARRRR